MDEEIVGADPRATNRGPIFATPSAPGRMKRSHGMAAM